MEVEIEAVEDLRSEDSDDIEETPLPGRVSDNPAHFPTMRACQRRVSLPALVS